MGRDLARNSTGNDAAVRNIMLLNIVQWSSFVSIISEDCCIFHLVPLDNRSLHELRTGRKADTGYCVGHLIPLSSSRGWGEVGVSKHFALLKYRGETSLQENKFICVSAGKPLERCRAHLNKALHARSMMLSPY